MSRILDCPHCNMPLTKVNIEWRVSGTIKVPMNMETENGYVAYVGPKPNPGNHTVNDFEHNDPEMTCVKCKKEVPVPEWLLRPRRDNAHHYEIVDELSVMEEIL